MMTSSKKREKGQTLPLIAVGIVALMGMAALAIDVVTLYVARGEVQRSADAAALAAARAIADSGLTSLSIGDANYGTVQTAAENAANIIAADVAAKNLVSHGAPALNGIPTYNFTYQSDPIVTVNVKRTGLPVYFAKIWGASAASVSATASAEIYNSNNLTSYTPIAPRCVKPWMIVNYDPVATPPGPIVQEPSGMIAGNVVNGFPATLYPACWNTLSAAVCNYNPQSGKGNYLPAPVTPSATNICPSSCSTATNFEQSIACCDTATSYSCGQIVTWDNTIVSRPGVSGSTTVAGQCLIHASGPGLSTGQDSLVDNYPAVPNPQITAQSGPQNGMIVSSSHSIVTVPIVDPPQPLTSPTVTIVGFAQLFINAVPPAPPPARTDTIGVTVLNVSGCATGGANGAAPIVGSGSAVPVRLITPP